MVVCRIMYLAAQGIQRFPFDRNLSRLYYFSPVCADVSEKESEVE